MKESNLNSNFDRKSINCFKNVSFPNRIKYCLGSGQVTQKCTREISIKEGRLEFKH